MAAATHRRARGRTVASAILVSEPEWELPLNVAAGTGQFVATLYAADGAC